MRVIVHAGAWKTGSSAIQAFLKRNLRRLRDRHGAIVAPMAKGLRGHARVFDALVHGDEAAARAVVDEFAALAEGRDDAVILVSSEHVWPLPEDRMRLLRDRLATLSEDVRALLYIRPQEEMWASSFAQEAKFLRIGSATRRWGGHEYLNADIVERGLYYSRCLDQFERVFGPGRVAARVYAREAFEGGDVVRDFLAHVGVRHETGLRFPAADRNPSLGWKAVSLSIWAHDALFERLREANPGREDDIFECFLRSFAETRDRFSDRDWVGRAAAAFDMEELAAIRAHYEEDNRCLFERWFGGRDVFGPVRETRRTPLGIEHVPASELAAAKRRLLVNFMRAGIDAGPVEADLVPSPSARAMARLIERSPIGWIDRRSKPPILRR